MRKRTKIIIGIAVFVVTMGLIVTAVIMAVLNGKKNAELFPHEYDYLGDNMVNGAYVGVIDGNWMLLKDGSAISARYAYLEYVGYGAYAFRDFRGGRGYIDTEGDALLNAREGIDCVFADGEAAIVLEGRSVTSGGFTDTLHEGETIVRDYGFNRALLPGMYAVTAGAETIVRWDGGSVRFRTAAPTGVRGLLFAEGADASGVYSLVKREYSAALSGTDASDISVMNFGETVLAAWRGAEAELYNTRGELVVKTNRSDIRGYTDRRERDGMQYEAMVNAVYSSGKYYTVRDGRMAELGEAVASTRQGFIVLKGREVYDADGRLIRKFDADVRLLGDAYAVAYERNDKHYIEPLDGRAFECPENTVPVAADTGEAEQTVYGSEANGALTVYGASGAELGVLREYDPQSVVPVVRGGRLFQKKAQKLYLEDGTYVDAIAENGRFAFKADAGKITVIKTDTGAEYYYYIAGKAEFRVNRFGTAFFDPAGGLWGFVNADGKLALRPVYKSLEAFNGYLAVRIDDTLSLTDMKGKILKSGIDPDSFKSLGVCAYIETRAGASVVDARGRSLLDDITEIPQKLSTRVVYRGAEYEAEGVGVEYYRMVSGKIRVLKAVH